MQKVARGVGLSGLAALILACAMAAPAVALKIPNPTIPLGTGHITPHQTPPSYRAVPQNSKTNLGRPVNPTYRLNSQKGGGATTGGAGTAIVKVDSSSPKIFDPALSFTPGHINAHRNQLDSSGSLSGPGYNVTYSSKTGGSTSVGGTIGGVSLDFYSSPTGGYFTIGSSHFSWS